MTEQPPATGPDFEPPGAGQDRPPSEPEQAPPVGGANYPPPANDPLAQSYQPGPPPYQPTPGYATAAPATGGRGSIALGVGITILALILDWVLWVVVPPSSDAASVTFTLAGFLPFGLVLAGIILAAIPRTTRTGAGILLGIGGAVLIAGGLCIALIAGLGS